MNDKVERWGIYECALSSDTLAGAVANPFTDVEFGARFKLDGREVSVGGFYDGDGVWRVRFSPDVEGSWSHVTFSDRDELNARTGDFVCTPQGEGNHGPVRVANTFHFAYGDGSPYKQIGTTCYAWIHQGDELEEQTLESLRAASFNKIRMCVFPKHYDFSHNEPVYYAFEKRAPAPESGYAWDHTRFDPAFWRHFEKRVEQLRDLGLEADLIVFHPYDRWGFSDMGRKADDLYIRYLIARLSAFRNVWWSMANEYDLMESRTTDDWDRYLKTFQDTDPHDRLRGIHNCRGFYDHTKPCVTHCSIQSSDLNATPQWRETYGKPVVVDECCYEGNTRHGWGNITAQEMVRRFWRGTVGGGYVGHGETYVNPEEILWWSKGGKLHGQSPPRLAFLRRILEEGPAEGLTPGGGAVTGACEGTARKGDDYFLGYFGVHQPASLALRLPEGKRYRIEALDTWVMTVEMLSEAAAGVVEMPFAGKPYMAVRARAVG